MPLFDSKMIHKRWLKSTLSDPLPEANFQPNLIYNFQTATNISSAIQRGTNKSASYNQIFRFTQELAQTILSGSETQARDKFEVLKLIRDIWESHIQFYLKPITIDENNDDSNDENIDEDDSDERNYSMATTTPDFESNSSNEKTQQTTTSSNINIAQNPSITVSATTSSQPLTSTKISENNDEKENQSSATETNILLIGNRKIKNPIEDDHEMCKQANRRGRPTAEQVKQNEDLLKQFLNIIVSNKPKLDAVFANKKAKKLINEEDLIVTKSTCY